MSIELVPGLYRRIVSPFEPRQGPRLRKKPCTDWSLIDGRRSRPARYTAALATQSSEERAARPPVRSCCCPDRITLSTKGQHDSVQLLIAFLGAGRTAARATDK